MASFAAARLRLRGDRLPGPDRGGEPRSTFRIMPYLLPLFVLMLRMTGALGLRIRRRILRLRILRVRRGSAAGAWLGAAGMITRAPSRKRSVPSTTTRSPTDTPELTAAIGPSVGPILTGRTDTLLSALMT